jgi:hypothetical protein
MILQTILKSFSRLFADDTSLLYSSNNVNEIEVIVNHPSHNSQAYSKRGKIYVK